MIRFNCSCCGNVIEVSDELAGQSVNCPYSGRQVPVLQLPEAELSSAIPLASPVASDGEPDPFDIANPFTNERQPSAWERIKERNARERRQRNQGMIALAIETVGVALLAAVGASIGGTFAGFFTAIRDAVVGAVIGGSVVGIFAALVVTGALRPFLSGPIRMAVPTASAPSGEPMVTPFALILAFCGVLIGGIIGAAMGTGTANPNADGRTILEGAFFGGMIGAVPAVIWWVRARRS